MSYSQQAREKAPEMGTSAENKGKEMGHKMTAEHPSTIGEQKTAPAQAAETAHGAAQKVIETAAGVAEQCKQTAQHATQTKRGLSSKMETAKQTAGHAAQYASHKLQTTKTWAERHPYGFWLPILSVVFLYGWMMAAIPLSLFGVTATNQNVLSRLWYGKYDYYSYRKGSPEAHAHAMLDQALQRYMHHERQSTLSKMLESIGMKSRGTTETTGGITSQMMQQLLSKYGQQQQQIPERHYLPESIYSMLPGTSKRHEETPDMTEFFKQMMKGGMMEKGARSSYESTPSSSSWFGRKKQQPEHEYDTSMFSSLFGHNDQTEMPQEKPGFFSRLTGKAKNVVSYTGLTESEEEQLKRLINEAAEKANRAL